MTASPFPSLPPPFSVAPVFIVTRSYHRPLPSPRSTLLRAPAAVPVRGGGGGLLAVTVRPSPLLPTRRRCDDAGHPRATWGGGGSRRLPSMPGALRGYVPAPPAWRAAVAAAVRRLVACLAGRWVLPWRVLPVRRCRGRGVLCHCPSVAALPLAAPPPLPLSAHPRGRPPGCWPDCLFALSVHAHHSHGPIAALPPSPSSPIPPSPAYRPALSPPPRRCVSLRWRCPRRGRRGEPWVLAGQAGAACVRVAPVVVVAAATLAVTAAVAVTAHVRGRGAPPARALP